MAPKIGLVNHIVLAENDADAVAIAKPAWAEYVWNLEAPRRLEAEQRGLTQFLGAKYEQAPGGTCQIVRQTRRAIACPNAPKLNSSAAPPPVTSAGTGVGLALVSSPARLTPSDIYG